MSFKPGDILQIKPNHVASDCAKEEFCNCLVIEVSNRFRGQSGNWFETNDPYLQILLGAGTQRSVNVDKFGHLFELVIENSEDNV